MTDCESDLARAAGLFGQASEGDSRPHSGEDAMGFHSLTAMGGKIYHDGTGTENA